MRLELAALSVLTLVLLTGNSVLVAQGPVRPLANDFVTVFASPDPASVYCYTPGLARLASGRLVATLDLGGPGLGRIAQEVAGPDGQRRLLRGKVYTSDDHGQTWTHRADYPFYHARPFEAGGALYVLGHAGDLMIIRSGDGGRTWSQPAQLTTGQRWHQSACNVHYARGCVYLVMERYTKDIPTWAVAVLAPVLMRGPVDQDLTQKKNWTWASELVFEDAVDYRSLDGFGVPFFQMQPHGSTYPAPRRNMAPIGWLETNVVQIVDPQHYWFDDSGRTFHLFMRDTQAARGWLQCAKWLNSPIVR